MNKKISAALLSVSLLLVGCGKEIDRGEVQMNNGLIYKYGDTDPFSGTVLNDKVGALNCNSEVNNGKYDGVQTCFSGEKKAVETEYKSGQKNGLQTTWNTVSGKVLSKANYKSGLKDGQEEIYSLFGDLARSANYENGKAVGSWREWAAIYNVTVEKHPVLSMADPDELMVDLEYVSGVEKTGMRKRFDVRLTNPEPGAYYLYEEHYKNGAKSGNQLAYIIHKDKPKKRILVEEQEYENGKPAGEKKIHSED